MASSRVHNNKNPCLIFFFFRIVQNEYCLMSRSAKILVQVSHFSAGQQSRVSHWAKRTASSKILLLIIARLRPVCVQLCGPTEAADPLRSPPHPHSLNTTPPPPFKTKERALQTVGPTRVIGFHTSGSEGLRGHAAPRDPPDPPLV